MREPLTKKIKWCYALGQFGWSILSGIVIGIITMLGRLMDEV